jgi:hypothetical protein
LLGLSFPRCLPRHRKQLGQVVLFDCEASVVYIGWYNICVLGLIVVGDIIHIYTAGLHIGEKALLDVANWNDMTWGNIGITVMLLVSRILWFLSIGIKKVEDGKKKA